MSGPHSRAGNGSHLSPSDQSLMDGILHNRSPRFDRSADDRRPPIDTASGDNRNRIATVDVEGKSPKEIYFIGAAPSG